MGILETVRAFFSPVIRLERDPTPLLILSGTFDERAEQSLKAAFRQLEEGSVQVLVLNVSKAKFVGDHIVGELLGHLAELKNRNVCVKIVAGPAYKIKHGWWLHLTRIDELFETYLDQDQAIKSACQLYQVKVHKPAVENLKEAIMDLMAQQAFAMRLVTKFTRTPGNIFISPFSIWSLLALLLPAARGQTRELLGSVLGLPTKHNDTGWIPELRKFTSGLGLGQSNALESSQEAQRQRVLLSETGRRGQKTYTKFDLAIANAVWVQKGCTIRSEYLDLVAAALGAHAEEMDIAGNPTAACRAVNQWAKDNTAGKIDRVLSPGDLAALTRLILTNATYFKAAWAKTFEPAIVGAIPFKLLNGSEINVPMMSQQRTFPYFERDGLQMVELPYAGVHLSMVIVLPPQIRDFDAALTPDTFQKLLNSLDHTCYVWLWLPKFKVSNALELIPALHALGLEPLFGDTADLSGMSAEPGIHINQVKQASWVQVDEYGTEAAAVTVVQTIGGVRRCHQTGPS